MFYDSSFIVKSIFFLMNKSRHMCKTLNFQGFPIKTSFGLKCYLAKNKLC